MRVKKLIAKDYSAISRLFYDTVHHVNRRDYSAEQVAAWAPRVYEDAWWRRRFRDSTVLVAEDNGEVVGFVAFEETGYIDSLFVHHQRQREGIGALLMHAVVREARERRLKRLWADVSITAEPFFRHLGFVSHRQQKKHYHGQNFHQFVMEKRLLPPAR